MSIKQLNPHREKLIAGSVLSLIFFCLSKAYSQTTLGNVPTPDQTGNFFVAFWMQAVYNPSSFAAIGLLGVVAWLCDDLPFIDSKYVKHITVIVGMATYWLFTDPETVAKISKHPISIYLSYGAVCGALAYLGHAQVISRLMDFFVNRKQQAQTQTQ